VTSFTVVRNEKLAVFAAGACGRNWPKATVFSETLVQCSLRTDAERREIARKAAHARFAIASAAVCFPRYERGSNQARAWVPLGKTPKVKISSSPRHREYVQLSLLQSGD
jgi:hypothetical protein